MNEYYAPKKENEVAKIIYGFLYGFDTMKLNNK